MGKKRKLVVLIVALVFLLQLPLLALTQAQAETVGSTQDVTEATTQAETAGATQAEPENETQATTQSVTESEPEAETQAATPAVTGTVTPVEPQAETDAVTSLLASPILRQSLEAASDSAVNPVDEIDGGIASDGAARGEFDRFFTDVKLLDPVTGEDLTDGQDIPRDSQVKIQYEWYMSQNDSKEINEGDTYTFTVPTQFKAAGGSGQIVDSDDGGVVATITIDDNNVATVTFTNKITTYGNIGGTFSLTVPFNEDEVGDGPIEITVGDNTISIVVDFAPPEVKSEKAGTYNPATKEITWTVTLNRYSATVQDGHLIDKITPGGDKGQTYVDKSFKVTDAEDTIYDAADGGARNGTFSYTPKANDDTTTGTLDYTFDESYTFDGKVTVTYKTTLTDPSKYYNDYVSNTATFEHDETTNTITGKAYVPEPDYIKKNGSFNSDTQQIDWTITFNSVGEELNHVTITDPLPGGLTPVGGTVKLNDALIIEGTGSNQYTYDADTKEFIYHVDRSTEAGKLTFSTKIPDDFWLKDQGDTGYLFENKATLDFDNKPDTIEPAEKDVRVYNTIIQKTGIYDYNTHQITWTITVNKDKRELPNARIVDILQGNQEYMENTLTLSSDAGDAPNNELTSRKTFQVSVPDGKTLTYNFGDIGQAKIVMTFKTKLTDPKDWAGSTITPSSSGKKYFYNNVTLTAGNTNVASSEYPTPYTTVSPQVVQKSGSYDYTTHTLTWNVTVNANKIPLTNVQLTDSLKGTFSGDTSYPQVSQLPLDNFDLQTYTLAVDGVALNSSDSSDPEPGTYHYDGMARSLKVNFGNLNDDDAATRTKTLTFKMKLNKAGTDYDNYFSENWDKSYGKRVWNTVTVTSDENPEPSTASHFAAIKNTIIRKTPYYTRGKSYVDWVVQVNQNSISIPGTATLKDVFEEGLILDTSTIKVYKQTIAPNGNLTPSAVYNSSTGTVNGTPEELAVENVDYDVTTRSLKITLPEGVGDGSPCVVTFRTLIDNSGWVNPQGQHVYTNTIDLNGITYNSGEDNPVEAIPPVITGGASGTKASVSLSKVDAEDSPLAGAVFGLYDQYDNWLRNSDPTNDAGSTAFDDLNYSTIYAIKEETAPVDHVRPLETTGFSVNRDDKIQFYQLEEDGTWTAVGIPLDAFPSIPNVLKTANVTVKKVDDEAGAGLAGAEFTLYAGSDDSGVVAGTGTTNADGTLTLQDISYGDYVLYETKAPADYYGTVEDPITVSLHDWNNDIVGGTPDPVDGNPDRGGGTLDLGDVDNTLKTADVTVRKVDVDTGAALAGAEFTLYAGSDDSGEVVATGTTDDNGTLTFSDIDYGDYVLYETKAPADYYATVEDPITVSLHDSNDEVVWDNTIKKGTLTLDDVDNTFKTADVTLKKVDATTGVAIAGAEFTIYAGADGTGAVVATGTTAEDGTLTLSDIPYGDYVLRETQAHADYKVLDEPISLSLHDSNGKVVWNNTIKKGTLDLGDVSNIIKTANVTLKKVDANTGAALAGAEFKLYAGTDDSGTAVATGTTNADGTLTLPDIPYGDYVLYETTAPDGYYSIDPISISVHDVNDELVDGTLNLGDIADTPIPPLPKTGDEGFGISSWLALGASVALIAAAALHRFHTER